MRLNLNTITTICVTGICLVNSLVATAMDRRWGHDPRHIERAKAAKSAAAGILARLKCAFTPPAPAYAAIAAYASLPSGSYSRGQMQSQPRSQVQQVGVGRTWAWGC